jgi:hypothetical protein
MFNETADNDNDVTLHQGEIMRIFTLALGDSITHGCLEDVKMWMSGGQKSGLSMVPTRTNRTAGPACA